VLQPAKLTTPVLALERAPQRAPHGAGPPAADPATLDAIHIATAKLAGAALDHLISYDKRMVSAAEAAELSVAAPG
jgi:predicted nucleic acid-binding protein